MSRRIRTRFRGWLTRSHGLKTENISTHDKSELLRRRGRASRGRPALTRSFAFRARKGRFQPSRVPYSIKILLENLLRFEDGLTVKRSDIEYVAKWDPKAADARSTFARRACCCRISRACRAWWIWRRCATRWRKMGADPKKANPLMPVDLVIDHSVQVDQVRHRRMRSTSTRCSSFSATRSAMRF